MIYEITDQNFAEEVERSDIPCVIEFTAGFCTMCDDMVPCFEALSEKLDGQVKFCIVNTDLQKQLRILFAVASWPFIVFVRDGMKTPLFDQVVTEKQLEERIRYVLDGGEAPTFPVRWRR